MIADLPRWMMRDPAEACERLEEQGIRQRERSPKAKQARARQGLEQLFEEDRMGRKLDISPRVSSVMFQWGDWSRRPQFWTDLRVTPFCKLLGIGQGREIANVKLDPQSLSIHKAVMRQAEAAQIVLVGYYVGLVNWDVNPEIYKGHGITRKTFYELLRVASISTVNSARI